MYVIFHKYPKSMVSKINILEFAITEMRSTSDSLKRLFLFCPINDIRFLSYPLPSFSTDKKVLISIILANKVSGNSVRQKKLFDKLKA